MAVTREVLRLSTRFFRLYLLRLSVTFGFRVYQHTHRPQSASLPVRVPKSVSLLIASFGRFASRPWPCFSLRLLSLLPIISFHMISLSPCRAHWLRLRRVESFCSKNLYAICFRPANSVLTAALIAGI
jgi:hypothetical protein